MYANALHGWSGKNTLLRRDTSVHPEEEADGQERSSKDSPVPMAEFMTTTRVRPA